LTWALLEHFVDSAHNKSKLLNQEFSNVQLVTIAIDFANKHG